MRAVITVVGKDMVGIVSRVAGACTTCNINVTEVTQSVLQDLFCMIMLADISKANLPFGEFAQTMKKLGAELGLSIHVMHEDIFNSMHRI